MTAQTAKVAIQPLVGWPREAEQDKTYLITVDVRLAAGVRWPYEQEEYPIHCVLAAGLKYSVRPLGRPAVVLHRFGGSYGPARFLLTAREPAEDCGFRLSLLNRWGMPILRLPLPMRIVAASERDRQTTVVQLVRPPLTQSEFSIAAAPAHEPENSDSSPDASHYELVMRQMVQDGDLVPLLGSRLTEVSSDSPQDGGLPPNSEDLAAELARRARVTVSRMELPRIAQYVRLMDGRPALDRWLEQILTDAAPGPVHRFLARFPKTVEALGLKKKYQLIVSANFDTALEQAFDDEGEPYDLATYVASGQDRGRFVHFPFDGPPMPIARPNEYSGFPFTADGDELSRTVIVKVHGTVDFGNSDYRWRGNYVITEDDYIAYLSGSPVEGLVPIQILAKLRQSNCLFFGYTMGDWTQRVFLRRIWGDNFGGTSWAVKHDANTLEQQFWRSYRVSLQRTRPTDYVRALNDALSRRSDELA